jgi:hypothetical protein
VSFLEKILEMACFASVSILETVLDREGRQFTAQSLAYRRHHCLGIVKCIGGMTDRILARVGGITSWILVCRSDITSRSKSSLQHRLHRPNP